jgi:hypothetical protein
MLKISVKTIRTFPSYKEFVDDMEKSGDFIEHNIPKKNKTKEPILNIKDLNKDRYKGPDFYLLNRVNKILMSYLFVNIFLFFNFL